MKQTLYHWNQRRKESFRSLSKANALRAKAKSLRAQELAVVNQSVSDLEKRLKSLTSVYLCI